MGGLGRRMPLTAVTFALGALSLARHTPARRLRLEGCHPHRAGGQGGVGSVGASPGHRLPDRLLHGPGACADLPREAVPGRGAGARAASGDDHPAGGPSDSRRARGLPGPWLARGLGGEMHLHLGLTPVLASFAGLGGLGLSLVTYRADREAPLAGTVAALDRASFVDRVWAFGYRSVLLPLSGGLRWVDRYLVDGLLERGRLGHARGGSGHAPGADRPDAGLRAGGGGGRAGASRPGGAGVSDHLPRGWSPRRRWPRRCSSSFPRACGSWSAGCRWPGPAEGSWPLCWRRWPRTGRRRGFQFAERYPLVPSFGICYHARRSTA